MRQQRFGSDPGVGHQCHFRRIVAHGLVGIDIDTQQGSGNLETTGEGHVVIGFRQLGANGQDHIGLCHQGPGRHHGLGGTDQQRMRRRQHALGIDGQGHRRLQQLGQAGQGRGGIDGAPARENQRPLGTGQQLAHLRDSGRVGAGAGDLHRLAGQQVVGVLDQHIEGNLDMHGAWAPGLEQGKGPGQHRWQLVGTHQGVGKRRHATDQRTLVGQLVELAAPAPQLATGLHAGDHQHGNRIGVGLAHGGGDVGHAGAGDDETHTGLAAGSGVAVGHEAGALLVARSHMMDGRTGQAAIQLHGVYPGNAEHLLDAITFQ